MSVGSRALRALLASAATLALVAGAPGAPASPRATAAPAPAPSSPPAAGGAATADPLGPARTTPRTAVRAKDGRPGRAARARTTARVDDTALTVTIDDLAPGVLPRTGPLVVRGTVTNSDLETWRDVNVYPLFGEGPTCGTCAEVMTTSAQLSLAASTAATTPVGERYTRDDRVRAQIDALAPGQSASYAITVPQRVLRSIFADSAPGVYWFGVHALGSSDASPRDTVADGRARTFLPVMPATAPAVDTALVLPLRARIERTADGALARPDDWRNAMALGGRLGSPLAFGAAAGLRPLTWLVDPAVLDAVGQLADGNAERSLEPADPVEPDEDAEGGEDGGTDAGTEPTDGAPSGEPSSSASPSDAPEDDASTAPTEPVDPAVSAATSWLRQARAQLTARSVAALPYGDPDLAAVGDTSGRLYGLARQHPSSVLDAWGVRGLPVATGPDGYLDLAAITTVDDDATLLLGDQLFDRENFAAAPPADARIGRRPLVVTSTGAAEGGPGPQEALSPIGLRQRILSEAAVRSLRAARERSAQADRLTVVLPAQLDAAGAGAFWAGLDVPWLRLTDLAGQQSSAGGASSTATIDPTDLAFTSDGEDDVLSPSVVTEALRTVRAARVLQRILGSESTIGDTLVGEALAGISVAERGRDDAASRLGRTRDWAEARLGRVRITAPEGVTLSSGSGPFTVGVRNDLDQPVTVRIEAASADADLRVRNPITVAARSSVSVPVEAEVGSAGVQNVTLRLTDVEGDPVGAVATTSVRSSQVGRVIWVIIGAGGGIFLVALALRLRRRLRGERATA
ncbi:DUF6049 family protein [Nocardioides sp.]|uniref:DUF6049 family protein n=1 Tax=Nocardioides sp. TaxID=35761 RepID=UPI0035112905